MTATIQFQQRVEAQTHRHRHRHRQKIRGAFTFQIFRFVIHKTPWRSKELIPKSVTQNAKMLATSSFIHLTTAKGRDKPNRDHIVKS
jgi:hypothetical protein